MGVNEYLAIVKRYLWMVLLLAVLTAATAYGYSKLQTPVYEATAKLYITSRPDFGQTQATMGLLRSFATYLNSSLRASAVIDELQIDKTPSQLLDAASFSASNSETVVQVSIEDTNPVVAVEIAQVWAEQLVRERSRENANLRAEDRIEAELLDVPTVRMKSPQTMVNTLAGSVFGVFLGLILALVVEWLRSGTIHQADDVERYLDIPVIASIPHIPHE